eukprot:COSAG02_NODE_2828_length_7940_cov_6.526081_4_plen_109_part_00
MPPDVRRAPQLSRWVGFMAVNVKDSVESNDSRGQRPSAEHTIVLCPFSPEGKGGRELCDRAAMRTVSGYGSSGAPMYLNQKTFLLPHQSAAVVGEGNVGYLAKYPCTG